MKFRISLRLFEFSLSEDIHKNTERIVNELSNSMNSYLIKQDYGDSILEYEIILYVVNMPVGYEHLFKDFKPKFTEHKVLTNKHTGDTFELNKYFNYSVKITGNTYTGFVTGTEEESKKILAFEILNSLSNLDALPKKVKDFDKEKFKSDMQEFFKEQNLL